jgi:protein phosphatase PTC7
MLRRHGFWLGKRLSFCYRHVCAVPEPKRAELGGEDAFLSLYNVQAVLDGVSWWKENTGVTAGLYSAALARTMYEYIEDELLGDTPASSFRLLEHAYESCKHGDVFGTSTALVATLQEPRWEIQTKDQYELILLEGPSLALPESVVAASPPTPDSEGPQGEGEAVSSFAQPPTTTDLHAAFATFRRTDEAENYLLDIAYVGDCSVMLIRGGRVSFVSHEQSHTLDYPFQLGTGSADTPKDGVRRLIPVEKGDLIVMGSDGVFDNLYPEQIAAAMWPPLDRVYREHGYVQLPRDQPGRAEAMLLEHARSRNLRLLLVDDIMAALRTGCDAVMRDAAAVANDLHCDSPYATKCIEDGALFEGGKPDDMTLVASVVGEYDDGDSGERFSSSEAAYPPPYRDWP